MFNRRRGILTFCMLAGVIGMAASSAVAQCQLERLIASDGDGGDQLGFSVALTDDYAILGAPFNSDAGANSGSAYIYRRVGTTWQERTKLVAPDAGMNDFFGATVAIHGDYAAVSAVLDDEADTNAGAVYVFHRNGNSWVFEDKFTASDGALDDELGTSLAIHGDYIIAGARNDDAGESSGCAYIFVRNGTTWTQQQKLTANDAAISDEFGVAVAISGEYVAIGAPLDNTTAADTGSVYIFRRTNTTWTQQTRMTATDGAAGNELGRAVAFSGDYVIAGARLADLGPGFNNAGAAYVFKRTNTTWAQQAKLTASDMNGEDLFGVSVGISGDYAVVGAFQDDDGGNASGSAYVFRRNGTTWVEDAKLTAFDDDPSDHFGFSAAMSGGFALIGTPDVDDFGSSSGTAYVFGAALDCNGNGDPDSCDIMGGVSSDNNGDGVPDECGGSGGDFDSENDLDHDMKDFRAFQNCFNRGGGLLTGCGDYDGEPDGDVDLDDYFMMEGLFDGP